MLSDEQRKNIELARQGGSIFFAGSAGECYLILRSSLVACGLLDMGKSFTLRELIRVLREGNTDIGDSTLHSYAGIGIGKDPVSKLKRKAFRDRVAAESLLTKVRLSLPLR